MGVWEWWLAVLGKMRLLNMTLAHFISCNGTVVKSIRLSEKTDLMIAYFNGRFLPKSDVAISPDDRGFLLADGVYEVLCTYDGRPFEMKAHFERLERSLGEIRITSGDGSGPAITGQLKEAIPELLHRNDLEEAHAKIYLQVTRGAAPRRHAFPEGPVAPTLYGFAEPYMLPEEKWEHGARAVLAPDLRWARCDIKSIALLPAVLANQQAMEQEADEAILVRDGVVTEGSHTSVLAAVDGVVVTHPLTRQILPGVTRKVVLELCEEEGIPVRELPVGVEELKEADELMLAGTTTGVMPIVEVDDWSVGAGRPGPVTRRLQEAFFERAGLATTVGSTS